MLIVNFVQLSNKKDITFVHSLYEYDTKINGKDKINTHMVDFFTKMLSTTFEDIAISANEFAIDGTTITFEQQVDQSKRLTKGEAKKALFSIPNTKLV